MLIRVQSDADPILVGQALRAAGLWVERLDGADGTTYRVVPPSPTPAQQALDSIAGIASVARPSSPHPLLDAHPPRLEVAGVSFGPAAPPVVMAGPCGVESEAHIHRVAEVVAQAGGQFLRGGAFKPRTSPYAFQGHGLEALDWLSAAARSNGLRVVTECLSTGTADAVARTADLIQVGSRNMHNYDLLRAIAATARPVLLKRGMAATLDEWRLAAEYCLYHGAPGVLLCERGIRSFDPHTRSVLDLGAVALLAGVDGLPVVVDPSHAAGRRDLVPALSRAAVAAGACGLLIEVHDSPGQALSDGPQAVPLDQLPGLLAGLRSQPVTR